LCRLAWRRGVLATEFLGPCRCLGRGAIIDGYVVAAASGQMPGHRKAHYTQTEKCHFCHCAPLLSDHGGTMRAWWMGVNGASSGGLRRLALAAQSSHDKAKARN